MSFSKLLEKLLAEVIVKVGPALIELIIRWLKGLGDDEVKEVAKGVAEAMAKKVEA